MNLSQYRLLTVQEFCELAAINRTRFTLEVQAKRIQVVTVGIRGIRIEFQEYLRWLDLGKTALRSGRKGGSK